MADIFDEVSSSGDIFDEVSTVETKSGTPFLDKATEYIKAPIEAGINLGHGLVSWIPEGVANVGEAIGAFAAGERPTFETGKKVRETIALPEPSPTAKNIMSPFMYPFEKLAEWGPEAGSATYEKTKSPFLGALAGTLVEGAPFVAPMAIRPTMKGIRSAKAKARSMQESLDVTKPPELPPVPIERSPMGQSSGKRPPTEDYMQGFEEMAGNVEGRVPGMTLGEYVKLMQEREREANRLKGEQLDEIAGDQGARELEYRLAQMKPYEEIPVGTEVKAPTLSHYPEGMDALVRYALTKEYENIINKPSFLWDAEDRIAFQRFAEEGRATNLPQPEAPRAVGTMEETTGGLIKSVSEIGGREKVTIPEPVPEFKPEDVTKTESLEAPKVEEAPVEVAKKPEPTEIEPSAKIKVADTTVPEGTTVLNKGTEKQPAGLNHAFSDIHAAAREAAKHDNALDTETAWRDGKVRTTEGAGMPYSETRKQWDMAYQEELNRLKEAKSASGGTGEQPSNRTARVDTAGNIPEDVSRPLPFKWNGQPSQPVKFVAGEYAGMTGKVIGQTQKRYSKEADSFTVQVDGFPKPGGWDGKVHVGGEVIAAAEPTHFGPTTAPQGERLFAIKSGGKTFVSDTPKSDANHGTLFNKYPEINKNLEAGIEPQSGWVNDKGEFVTKAEEKVSTKTEKQPERTQVETDELNRRIKSGNIIVTSGHSVWGARGYKTKDGRLEVRHKQGKFYGGGISDNFYTLVKDGKELFTTTNSLEASKAFYDELKSMEGKAKEVAQPTSSIPIEDTAKSPAPVKVETPVSVKMEKAPHEMTPEEYAGSRPVEITKAEQFKDIERRMKELMAQYKGTKRVSYMNRTTPNIARGQEFDLAMSRLESEKQAIANRKTPVWKNPEEGYAWESKIADHQVLVERAKQSQSSPKPESPKVEKVVTPTKTEVIEKTGEGQFYLKARKPSSMSTKEEIIDAFKRGELDYVVDRGRYKDHVKFENVQEQEANLQKLDTIKTVKPEKDGSLSVTLEDGSKHKFAPSSDYLTGEDIYLAGDSTVGKHSAFKPGLVTQKLRQLIKYDKDFAKDPTLTIVDVNGEKMLEHRTTGRYQRFLPSELSKMVEEKIADGYLNVGDKVTLSEGYIKNKATETYLAKGDAGSNILFTGLDPTQIIPTLKSLKEEVTGKAGALEAAKNSSPEWKKVASGIGEKKNSFSIGDFVGKSIKDIFDRFHALKKPSPKTYEEAIIYHSYKDIAGKYFKELQDQIRPAVQGTGDLFSHYIKALRDESRATQGHLNPGEVTFEEAQIAKRQIEDAYQKIYDRNPEELRKASDTWNEWTKKYILDQGVESGVISTATRDAILDKNSFYARYDVIEKMPEDFTGAKAGEWFSVPKPDVIQAISGVKEKAAIQKKISDLETELFSIDDMNSPKGKSINKEIFKLKQRLDEVVTGTTKTIADPVDATLRKFLSAQAVYARNKVASTLVEDPNMKSMLRPVVESVKQFEILKEQGADPVMSGSWDVNKFDTIARVKDGVVEKYLAPKYISDAMKHLSPGWTVKNIPILGPILEKSANVFRKSATTLYLPFTASNFFRDSFMAMATSPVYNVKNTILYPLVDAPKGLWEAVKYETAGKGQVNEFLSSGGGFGYSELSRGFDLARQKFTDSNIMVVSNPKNLIRLMEGISGTIELTPRMAIYNRALKQGASKREAALLARKGTIDFNKGGELVKALNQFTPFLNARVQAWQNVMEALKNDPINTTSKLMVLAVVPAVSLYFYNRMNFSELLDDIPADVRNNYFVFITGTTKDKEGKTVPQYGVIPKGDVGQLAANGIEHMLDRFYSSNKPEFSKFAVQWMSDMSPVAFANDGNISGTRMLSSLTPPIIKAPLEHATNKKFYTDRPIIPPQLEKLPPKYQTNKKMPPLYQNIGELTDTSPLVIQNYMQNLLAGYGREGLAPGAMVEGITGRFVKTRGGERESKGWDLIDNLDKGYRAARMRAKEAKNKGDHDEASNIMSEWNANLKDKIAEIEDVSGKQERGGLLSQYSFTKRKAKNLIDKQYEMTPFEKKITKRRSWR